ncbi:hypothetical protein H5410_019312 [Solanum commersonii]|uniref:Uncharacterized protein n=1 Tax=Solanum commersonii TaxID=4109 RepID=A0A9J5Z7Z5_SOLCO|nr:hypothetical protein H5410_019312 [Solanum commersonii]
MEPVGLHYQNGPFSRSNEPRIYGLFGDLDSDLIFAEFFCGRPFRHVLMSQLALMAKTSHFQGQTSLSMNFLLIWNSDLIFAKIFLGRPLRP